MKNLFILLVLIAAAIFGIKLYVEHRYEKELDEAIQMVGNFVPVRYDNVELGVDGSLSLHGLEVTPPNSAEPVSFGTIKLTSSDRFIALKGASGYENGKFPESVSISFSNISFGSDLVDLAPKKDHCRRFDSSFVYSEIGIDSILADLTMGFDFSDPYNAVYDLYYSDDIGTADFKWTFDADSMIQSFTGTRKPQIREIALRTELNEDVAKSIAEYCADLFGVSPEAYLTKVVSSSKYSENSFGVDLGPDFRNALLQYMKGGSQISLRSTPNEKLLDFQNAQFFKSKDVVRWLNLTLSIEGETIPIKVVEKVAQETGDKAAKKAAVPKLKYTPVSVRQAAQHINAYVQINRTKGRKPIKGRLLKVEDRILSVEVFRGTGVMTLTVPGADIETFEVYLKQE